MTTPITHGDESVEPQRPFSELRDTGLLWLLNRVVFHPRGFALALHYTGKFPDMGECVGWSLHGDGSEPWSMGDPPAEYQALGAPTEDELFARVSALLKPGPRPDPIRPNDPPDAAIPMRLLT